MNKSQVLEKIKNQVLQPEYVCVVKATAMLLHDFISEVDNIELCILEGLEYDAIIPDNTINLYLSIYNELEGMNLEYETIELDGLKINIQTKENLYKMYKLSEDSDLDMLKILEENGGIK